MIAGAIMLGAGLIGAATRKRPKYNMGPMNEALALINKQYGQINEYFTQANAAFESQYQRYYGQEMQDAVNAIAGSGIYESPVSQNVLNRKQIALGEQYASGKSALAGQKLSAIGSVDQQRIAYMQNLANMQYQRQLAQSQSQSQLFGTIGAAGASLLGV